MIGNDLKIISDHLRSDQIMFRKWSDLILNHFSIKWSWSDLKSPFSWSVLTLQIPGYPCRSLKIPWDPCKSLEIHGVPWRSLYCLLKWCYNTPLSSSKFLCSKMSLEVPKDPWQIPGRFLLLLTYVLKIW